MKLSISNIAWSMEYDEEMYTFLSKNGFAAIEIAPTRIFQDNPYDKLKEAKKWAENLKSNYNLSISSIQSIWYGKKENLFTSKEEQKKLIDYTKKAVLFAESINCHNIVFGCPRNRDTDLPVSEALSKSKYFFYEIEEFAKKHNTVIAIEANPEIYNTHFVNYTKEAFEASRNIGSTGFMVNVDLGTIIQNEEEFSLFEDYTNIINHIHISEPNLEIIKKRKFHSKLFRILKNHKYSNYVSIEMKNCNDIEKVKKVALYIKKCKEEVFNAD